MAADTLTRIFARYIMISMITTVTTKNMISIPAEVTRKMGIKPGWKLDWEPGPEDDEITVHVIPDRAEMAKRLKGKGKSVYSDGSAVSGLVAEREAED